jgi:DNA processing protein
VPGSPLDPRAKGTNRLIREGATLTESADDVLAALGPIVGRDFREPDGPAFRLDGPTAADSEVDRLRTTILEALGPTPVEVDELVRLSGAPISVVLTIILELELAGRVARQAGNRVGWA